jgi:Tfp pilus assembly protein PilF
MLTRRGQLDEAHEQLEQALKLEPDSVPATYQLAQVLQKKGDTARARELFARVSKAKAEEREQFASRGLQQIVREGAR